jgi:hypothetical protein
MLSDVGTSNPIAARLAIQTNNLTQPFPLTEKQKEDIFGILGMEVRERLVNCQKIFIKLHEELIRINGIKIEDCLQRNAVTVPTVIDLKHLCESFLYEAKSTLRDILKLFDVFYGEKFTEASKYDKAYQWAEKRFGKDDSLSKMLKNDHETWIQEIVRKRNAVEHPGGYSGYLHINNIELLNTEKPPFFQAPTWFRNDAPPTSILHGMETFINNTLELCEDILVILLEKLPQRDIPLIIVEIPEEQRDPSCPIRLQTSFHPDYLKKFEQ